MTALQKDSNYFRHVHHLIYVIVAGTNKPINNFPLIPPPKFNTKVSQFNIFVIEVNKHVKEMQ